MPKPKYRGEGRTANFIHQTLHYEPGSSRGKGRFDGGGDRHKLNFVQHQKGRGIQRHNDDDIAMDGEARGGRSVRGFQGKGRRRGGGGPWRGGGQGHNNNQSKDSNRGSQIHNFGPSWHKITIFNGASISREFVLTALANAAREQFVPISYTALPPNSVFFVETRKQAESIAECNGRITDPNAQKINFKVNHSGPPPHLIFDDGSLSKVKQVLERCFISEVNALNLENFQMSREIVNEFYAPLSRPYIIQNVIHLIEPVIGRLISLDLSNNRLTTMEHFAPLKSKAPFLQVLNLSHNKIRDLKYLEPIQGLDIQKVFLVGNPLCERIENHRERYTRAVRKIFSKIVELDGLSVPQIISFEPENTKLPNSLGSFYCNEDAKQVVLAFLEQYLKCFDMDDRMPLLDAYHDNATMSMACAYQQSHVSASTSAYSKLSYYIGESRNLLNKDKQRRTKFLHTGKLDIVATLNKFPKSLHDLNSLVLDMTMAQNTFILFNVCGVFKERLAPGTPLRSFSRTFTIVPLNAGFVISNELIFITNPTSEQHKAAFKAPTAPTPSPSPIPYVQQVGNPQPIASSSTIVSEAHLTDRQTLIQQFSQESGMNNAWAEKCLNENNWDYTRSGHVFLELHKAGKIPPDAFIK